MRRAGQAPETDGHAASPPAAWQPDETWVRDDSASPADTGPSAEPQTPAEGGRRRHSVPGPVVEELAGVAGRQRGTKLAARLAEATYAYDRDRYQDARRILRPLVTEAADAPAVRELNGLVLYRLGRWAAAAKELEAYRLLSGSYDQYPVLADCYRALRRYRAADRLWAELRDASPSAELVAEGRIVAAGSLADRGDLPGAITVLERSGRNLRSPRPHHLRQWYALADLYERAGDLPRARDLFGRIVRWEPDAYDAGRRLRALT